MIIRVAICPSLPELTYPRQFHKHLSTDKPIRIALAELLDKIPNTHKTDDAFDKDSYNFFMKGYDEKNWYIKSKNKFSFINIIGYHKNGEPMDEWHDIEIVEVDTSKKWMVDSEHDYGEFINYFEYPQLIDERYNMYSY